MIRFEPLHTLLFFWGILCAAGLGWGWLALTLGLGSWFPWFAPLTGLMNEASLLAQELRKRGLPWRGVEAAVQA